MFTHYFEWLNPGYVCPFLFLITHQTNHIYIINYLLHTLESLEALSNYPNKHTRNILWMGAKSPVDRCWTSLLSFLSFTGFQSSFSILFVQDFATTMSPSKAPCLNRTTARRWFLLGMKGHMETAPKKWSKVPSGIFFTVCDWKWP